MSIEPRARWLAQWSFRICGAVVVAVFLLAAYTQLPNRLYSLVAAIPEVAPAGAIVVLGGSTNPDGSPNDASLRRTLRAIELLRARVAPFVILSGSPHDTRARLLMLERLGLRSNSILTAPPANTTREEALRLQTVLSPLGIDRILLVTNPQHLMRARPVFEREGFKVLTVPVDAEIIGSRDPDDRLRIMLLVFRELIARAYYRIAGYA